jgi:predicted PurR-regulated permease PerM
MAVPDRRTLDILLTTLLFAVVLATVYVARGALIVFAFAILLAYSSILQFDSCKLNRIPKLITVTAG